MPIGGKLRLKGEKKKEKKEKSGGVKRSLEEDENDGEQRKSSTTTSPEGSGPVVDTSSILTEAQKRHMAKKVKRESAKGGAAEIIKTTYRERVENFNMKLSTLTEHNDIPRVSAAGNG
jgi:protein FAM32A